MSITTAYISHGGGPLPLLERVTDEDGKGGANHKEMIEVLKTLSRDMRRPDVIVVVLSLIHI